MAMPPPMVPAPTTAAVLISRQRHVLRQARDLGRPRARRRRRSAAPWPRRSSPARANSRRSVLMPSSNGCVVGRLDRRRCSGRAPSGCGPCARSTCAWRRTCRARPWPRPACRSCRARAAAGACRRSAWRRRSPRARRSLPVDDRVDDAELLGLLGRHVAAGDDHLQRRLRADQARQALRAAAARQDADQHLGQPDLGARHGDAVVAGERILQPAAERIAVDRGDHRLRRCRPARRRCVAPGAARGLPNWRMSAPAMKLRPAPIITMAFTLGSASPFSTASTMPSRTPGAERVDRRIVDGDRRRSRPRRRTARAACRSSAILPGRFPRPRSKECPFFEAASKDKQSTAAFSGSGLNGCGPGPRRLQTLGPFARMGRNPRRRH